METVTVLRITVGSYVFIARFEEEAAPQTCAAFANLLPYQQKIIHARWSGEACWVPLGDYQVGRRLRDATSYPAPGEILFYPGGYSETEILFQHTARASSPASLASWPATTFSDDRRQPRAVARGGQAGAVAGRARYRFEAVVASPPP